MPVVRRLSGTDRRLAGKCGADGLVGVAGYGSCEAKGGQQAQPAPGGGGADPVLFGEPVGGGQRGGVPDPAVVDAGYQVLGDLDVQRGSSGRSSSRSMAVSSSVSGVMGISLRIRCRLTVSLCIRHV